jgi:hypothetical protein
VPSSVLHQPQSWLVLQAFHVPGCCHSSLLCTSLRCDMSHLAVGMYPSMMLSAGWQGVEFVDDRLPIPPQLCHAT